MNSVFITIDRGNTCTKAALWTPQGTMCAHGTFASDVSPCFIVKNLVGDRRLDVKRSALCSVRRHDDDREFLGQLAGLFPCVTVDAYNCEPLKIGYATPQTLGADRVAAAAGALVAAGHGNVLVADIGTAATFDYVDADGVFAGGNISAGITMRLDALHAHTSLLPEVALGGEVPIMGYDTPTAMRAGAVRGLVAELEYYRRCSGATVYLTGGDAATVLAEVPNPNDYIHDPFLVMRGLFSILKHND